MEKYLNSEVAKVQLIGENSTYKAPKLYPATGTHQVKASLVQLGSFPGTTQSVGKMMADGSISLTRDVGTLPGTLVPPGFEHNSHCICFKPDPNKPNPTMKYAELEMLSEKQAKLELAERIELMRKQRLFWRMKEMLMKEKY